MVTDLSGCRGQGSRRRLSFYPAESCTATASAPLTARCGGLQSAWGSCRLLELPATQRSEELSVREEEMNLSLSDIVSECIPY